MSVATGALEVISHQKLSLRLVRAWHNYSPLSSEPYRGRISFWPVLRAFSLRLFMSASQPSACKKRSCALIHANIGALGPAHRLINH